MIFTHNNKNSEKFEISLFKKILEFAVKSVFQKKYNEIEMVSNTAVLASLWCVQKKKEERS